VQRQAPDLASLVAALGDAGVQALVLRASDTPAPGPAEGDRGIALLVRGRDAAAAIAVLEPLSWRYSWIRRGLLRLLPMAYYWWDGGTYVELYWGLPAAPLPSIALAPLSAALWRTARAGPHGTMQPDPAALVVHVAVQACRPGAAGDDEWARLGEVRSALGDLTQVDAIARRTRVRRGVRRALAAASNRTGRPGRGPLFDGLLGLAWRVALAVQARARPRRWRRLLAGSPALGDAPIRCRVAGVEVQAGTGVFVPTPDAELFVEEALARLGSVPDPFVVEVGTGCGAIALALAAARPDAEVHAIELAADAVHWARRNARRLRLDRVTISRGSLLDPLRGRPKGRAAIVIANLPFYPADDYAAIGSVPRDTIQGPGADGLGLLRQLARDAIPLLRPGGSLLLQMFAWQWEVLSAELRELGYDPGTPRLSGPFAICPAELIGTGG